MIRVAHFSDLHYGSRTLAEADRSFAAAVDRAMALDVQAAVVSGDAIDHALDLHAPPATRSAVQVRRLADYCPILLLHGTFSHDGGRRFSSSSNTTPRHSRPWRTTIRHQREDRRPPTQGGATRR